MCHLVASVARNLKYVSNARPITSSLAVLRQVHRADLMGQCCDEDCKKHPLQCISTQYLREYTQLYVSYCRVSAWTFRYFEGYIVSVHRSFWVLATGRQPKPVDMYCFALLCFYFLTSWWSSPFMTVIRRTATCYGYYKTESVVQICVHAFFLLPFRILRSNFGMTIEFILSASDFFCLPL